MAQTRPSYKKRSKRKSKRLKKLVETTNSIIKKIKNGEKRKVASYKQKSSLKLKKNNDINISPNEWNEVVDMKFNPYAPGVPFKYNSFGVMLKYIDEKFWIEYIKENFATIYLLCYGELFECLICFYAKFILKNIYNKSNVQYVFPTYVYPAISLFDQNVFYKNVLNTKVVKLPTEKIANDPENIYSYSNVFIDQMKIKNCLLHYPSPFFFDKFDNVYFNMLHDYENTYKETPLKLKNKYPVTYRILSNLCIPIEHYKTLRIQFPQPKFDNNLRLHIDTLLTRFEVDTTLPIVLFDNCYFSQNKNKNKFINGQEYAARVFSKNEIKMLSLYCSKLKKQFVVMSHDHNDPFYKENKIKAIPAWNSYRSDTLCVLLNFCSHVISSNYNIYLSAALLRCKNITAIDNDIPGFGFDEIKKFILAEMDGINYNWTKVDILSNIYSVLITIKG